MGRECSRGFVDDPPITRIPFFFSSRRRHTRCLSDWSSDVCSSDLAAIAAPATGTAAVAASATAAAATEAAATATAAAAATAAAVLLTRLGLVDGQRPDRKSVV